MERMEVTGAYVEILSGKLELTEKQAQARRYGLEPTKKRGVYTVLRPVGFKRGEVFGYDGPNLGRGFMLDINYGRELARRPPPPEEKPVDKPDPLAPSTEGQASDPPSLVLSSMAIPDEGVLLFDLAKALGKSDEDAIATVKDYGGKVEKPDDRVPAHIAREILDDSLLVEEDNPDDEIETV